MLATLNFAYQVAAGAAPYGNLEPRGDAYDAPMELV